MSNLLEMKNISKSFPGVKALQDVNFSLTKGEVHCLIGANGAGKSTLMKILAGVYTKDDGQILLGNQPIEIKNPSDSLALGISTIHQELSLVEELNLAENIFLGDYFKPQGGFVNWQKMNDEATKLFSLLGLHVSPKKLVSEVSMGTKQMVEIAKAIKSDCKIIIMDEPSTALSKEEVSKLFEVINLLKEQGFTIVYISHKLEELYAIGDRVTVMRNGKWVITDQLKNIDQASLIYHITGRHIEKSTVGQNKHSLESLLEVSGYQNNKLANISFRVGKGEIVGLYGLVGSGRTELLRAIYGADPIETGELKLEGTIYNVNSPTVAVKLGMGLVPENRKTEGANLDLSILDNATLPSINVFSNNGFINRKKMKAEMEAMIKKLNIKANDVNVLMRNLSGGNQQKVIIAKWLLHQSKLMLFDEPTQGIDIGAKDEIYSIMKETAKQGMSILMATSEIEELITVCDRVLVMFEGKIIKEFTDPMNNKNDILNYAVSG